MYHCRPSVIAFSSRERKEREAISSVKVEASTKDTWSSGHALPVTICRASRTLRATENYIVVQPFTAGTLCRRHAYAMYQETRVNECCMSHIQSETYRVNCSREMRLISICSRLTKFHFIAHCARIVVRDWKVSVNCII